jgi:5'-3' exonuclease
MLLCGITGTSTMPTYLLVDSMNVFFRARHQAHRGSSLEDRVGFAIHVTLASVAAAWRDQRADHVVWCFEGRSWRKDHYEPYKRNRTTARAALSPREQEEDQAFFQAFDQLKKFLMERTNSTTLVHQTLEADDLIAGWIQRWPNDQHVIVSTDSDFEQLIAPNVQQYDGVREHLITDRGVFDKKGQPVVDRKTGQPVVPEPEWALFEKCMRGDTSDNIFSAFPGVREKSTKNRVGLREAFEDRHSQGWAWNNLMLQKWLDHNGVEHRVLNDYTRNRLLVDLRAQPPQVRDTINQVIDQAVGGCSRPQVGAYFLKFCGQHNLTRISQFPDRFVEMLNAPFKEKTHES